MSHPRSRQIQPVDGGCCPLSANSASGGTHVCKQGGGGGGGGTPFSPEGGWEGAMAPLPHPPIPWGRPCTHKGLVVIGICDSIGRPTGTPTRVFNT